MSDWRAAQGAYPKPQPQFSVDPAHTALVLVDLQNRTVLPEGAMVKAAFEESPGLAPAYLGRVQEMVMPNVRQLLSFWRAEGMRVVYLTIGSNLPDLSDMIRRLRRPGTTMYPKGTFQHNVVDEIAPLPSELVLNKTSTSGFTSTGLDRFLRAWGIESLVVCGVVTAGCVELTARHAVDLDYNVILVEDACADLDPEAHSVVLRVFARSYGLVRSTSEVIALLRRES